MVIGAVHGKILVAGSEDYFDYPITEEEAGMPTDELRAILGNEAAKVTSSFELKDNDFGRGFGVFVSVTLSCDQSADGVDAAADLASSLSMKYTQEAFGIGEALFDSTVNRKERGRGGSR